MIKLLYALIARDSCDNKLAVVCTHWDVTRGVRGRCIDPHFHKFVWSVFALSPQATSVEAVDLAGWKPGVDVESLPSAVLVHKVDEHTRGLAFSFPDGEEVEGAE
jgi:hypothetical protein